MPGMASRVLVTTRLFPVELETPTEAPLPGCRSDKLHGFSEDEVIELFDDSGVRVERVDALSVTSKYEHHPLAVRLVIGVVQNDALGDGLDAANESDIVSQLVPRSNHILQIAYESLVPENQILLSAVSAFRGSIERGGVLAAERAGGGRGKEEVRGAIRDLMRRNLLMYDDRKKLFDLHPVVRKYAYDRLVNREQIHMQLGEYFQSFDTGRRAESRSQLDPVVELFHQYVDMGDQYSALRLLYERLHSALVGDFGDVATGVELFTKLESSAESRQFEANPASIWYWYGLEFGKLLRVAGFAKDALKWTQRPSLDGRRVIYGIRKLADDNIKRSLDRARCLVSLGRFSGAWDCAVATIRDFQSSQSFFGTGTIAELRALQLELGAASSYMGNYDEAEELLLAWLDCLRQGSLSNHEGCLIDARRHRYLAQNALFREDQRALSRYLGVLGGLVERLPRERARFSWEADMCLCLQVRAWSALGEARRVQNAEMELGGLLRHANQVGLHEVEIEALHALAVLGLERGEVKVAERRALTMTSLAERGRLMPRVADGLLLLARVYDDRGEFDKRKMYGERAMSIAASDEVGYVPVADRARRLLSRT